MSCRDCEDIKLRNAELEQLLSIVKSHLAMRDLEIGELLRRAKDLRWGTRNMLAVVAKNESANRQEPVE